MKKIYLVLLVSILTSCVSVQKYNEHLQKNIAPNLLKSDVDLAYEKLQELHPELYWYIDKEDLDYKFDSLKTTINSPLNPSEFYQKLAPVVSEVRQGHLRVSLPARRYSRKEMRGLKNQKGLFGRMDYVVDKNRLFVIENKEDFENIEVGTEILEIKDEPVEKYLKKYRKMVNSDGYNTTFHKYYLAKLWPAVFTIENGILDSVKLKTKFNEEIKERYIHREKTSKTEKKKEKEKIKELEKKDENKNRDYNVQTKSFNRDLQFLDKDSTIAYIKIKTFSGIASKHFYKESFNKIKQHEAKYLILDIRDNFGGSLSEINNLYSYLAIEDFKFIKDVEVTDKNSMSKANYFSQIPTIWKPVAAIFYPYYLIKYTAATKERNGKYYLMNKRLYKNNTPKENAFGGKIYVLINGGSFSAASILPAKLKGDERAILVGEETGGANDGTVAGRYSTVKLPHSKLKIPIGLMLIQPNIEASNTQKGVTPHVEIIPTLQQILEKDDVQLDWVMKDIRGEHHQEVLN